MLYKTQHSSNKGFTLIEILITIMILGILATIATPNFLTWSTNKKIEDISTNIEGALKEAQSTAIRRNRTCNVWVTNTTASAVLDDASKTADPGCLPSGSRTIATLDSNLRIAGTGGSTGTLVKFSAVGTAIVTPSTDAFVIYRTDALSTGTRKCIVISSGIGIIKTGKYTGTLPLTLSSTPTLAETTAVADSCSIS
jgi:prepilin-type N-terminal cleavage/methylation domain-containing protein